MYKVIEEFLKPTIDERIDQNTLEHLKNIMKNLSLSPEQAMNAISIPPADQAKYAAKLTHC